MLNIISTINTIDLETETHYATLTHVNPSDYPQVHDFYELILILEGAMELEINYTTFPLSTPSLILLRPGDIHSKYIPSYCKHINLAFPKQTVDELLSYLNYETSFFSDSIVLIPIHLTASEYTSLETKLEVLHTLPVNEKNLIKAHLRHIILDILATYFIFKQAATTSDTPSIPQWLSEFITLMNDKEVFTKPTDSIIASSQKSHEHLCRVFKKHFDMTPTHYINNLRLNYAANLLIHTDHSITDIAFNCGFQSLSYFYTIFNQKYQLSPLKFRNAYANHNL